jgi:hypothetical protein
LTGVGQHHGGLPNRKSKIVIHKFFTGAWQKSDAPALQAGSSGSVTRRPPPAFARSVARTGCRAVAKRRRAGIGRTPAFTSSYGSASHFTLRETRPKHREKPHKLLEVGVTPTPATSLRLRLRLGRPIFREVIQLPDCKSGVAKQNWK